MLFGDYIIPQKEELDYLWGSSSSLFFFLRLQQPQFDELKKQKDASDRFVNIVKKYTYINELDANILNELIDRIVVHHKEKDKDGNTYQQIEIYYRFIGRLKPKAADKAFMQLSII